MKRLLVICGPTATGKTQLAIFLARLLDGEVVSADSRQVYKGLDIGTGKDLPVGAKFFPKDSKFGKKDLGFYEVKGIKVWGYDLVEPNEEFSVSNFVKIAEKIIEDIYCRGKIPVLVGGTGLYIKALVDGISTLDIPKNEKLRRFLQKKSVEKLFEILVSLDPTKAFSMNNSDRKNPRRLVRAIEVAKWKLKQKKEKEKELEKKLDVLFIGLVAAKDVLEGRIRERIKRRLRKGLEKEIKNLIERGIGWNFQAMQSIGYRQWRNYFDLLLDKSGKAKILGRDLKLIKLKQEAIKKWMSAEKRYAREQLAWFRKDERINWFDITDRDWRKKVEKLVRKWHNKIKAK